MRNSVRFQRNVGKVNLMQEIIAILKNSMSMLKLFTNLHIFNPVFTKISFCNAVSAYVRAPRCRLNGWADGFHIPFSKAYPF
jgi:hypothetical protein